MAYTFLDLQNQTKFLSTKNQGGTAFDTPIKDAINSALFTISREAPWRQLRRTTFFETVADYTTGTVTTSADSKTLTFSGANIITGGVHIGRRIKIAGVSATHTIETITGENGATTTDAVATAVSAATYEIFGQEQYNLPIQTGRIRLLWHEEFGHPEPLTFITDWDFFNSSVDFSYSDTPTHYREWGMDWVQNQPRQGSALTIASSSSADTAIDVMIHGTVSSFPDSEKITTNGSDGTTSVAGTKSFTNVDRVACDATTTGRITVTADSGNTTVATIPAGDTTAGIQYRKIQLFPQPDAAFPINVLYYKDPYRLVADEDIHELGHDFDEALVFLATSRMKYGQSELRDGDKFFALYTKQLQTLRRKNADKLDWLPDLKRPRESVQAGRERGVFSFANLPGNFGPMSR